MPEDTLREPKEWHKVWHKTYLKREIKAFLKNEIPSLQETVKIVKTYLRSGYVQKSDLRSIFMDIAISSSLSDEDSRMRFKLLKKELVL